MIALLNRKDSLKSTLSLLKGYLSKLDKDSELRVVKLNNIIALGIKLRGRDIRLIVYIDKLSYTIKGGAQLQLRKLDKAPVTKQEWEALIRNALSNIK